jgi:hypothetical protein
MNIIAKLDSTFNFIRIVTANKHEPLYEWLESKIDKPYLEIYEGLKDVEKINLDQLESAQYLFVFDDMNLVKVLFLGQLLGGLIILHINITI